MVMVQDFAELGHRIREVRLAVGMTQGELAKGAGIDRTAEAKIESGSRKVSAFELVRIARALRVGVGDLMATPAPDVLAARSSLDEDSSDSDRERARAEFELDGMWRNLEQLRSLGQIDPVRFEFGGRGLRDEEDAQALARDARAHLGIGEEPIGAISDALSRFGLWVRTTQEQENIDGLSMTPESGFGVAVIKEGLPPGRRRTTAAHELGHHLSADTYEASFHMVGDDDREHLIDVFAAEFLFPAKIIKMEKEIDRDGLIGLAYAYRVSWMLAIAQSRRVGIAPEQIDAEPRPTREDFLRVTGATPVEDLQAPGLARAWIRACVKARDADQITFLRANEIALGALSAGDSCD